MVLVPKIRNAKKLVSAETWFPKHEDFGAASSYWSRQPRATTRTLSDSVGT